MINPKVRDAIDHFCMREYGVMGDFETPTRVPLLYTTVCADEVEECGDPGFEYELQIYIDAVHARAIYCLGADPGLVEEFNDAHEMADAIMSSDFQSWYSDAVNAERHSGYYPKEWEFNDEEDTENAEEAD